MAAISINAAGSNANYYQAQNSLITNKSNTLPSQSQILQASEYINLALKKMPLDADNLDLAGRIDYLRSIYEQDAIKKLELLSSSKQKHLQAIEQRELWAYSEVNILFASSAAGEIDHEFMTRFSRAKALGPDDKFVIRDLTQIGIRNWNDLSDKVKTETVELVESTLRRRLISERDLRAYLYNNGQFHRICAQLEQFQEKQQLCNS